MRTRTTTLLTALVCVAALAGCSKETTSSANIKTGGIAALFDVTAESDSQSTIHVDLKVGGSSSNTYVILENGDKLTATADGESRTMQAVDDGEYEATFTTAAADTEFTVTLERPADTSAPNNRGTMPAPFAVTAPVSSDSVSRATDMTISWDQEDSNADMKLEISGDCIFSDSIDLPSNGTSYTLPKDKLTATDSKNPGTCDVTLTLTRTRSGSADPAFDSESWFKLHQVRTAKFTSTP